MTKLRTFLISLNASSISLFILYVSGALTPAIDAYLRFRMAVADLSHEQRVVEVFALGQILILMGGLIFYWLIQRQAKPEV